MSLPWSIYRELWTPYPPAPQGDYLRGKVVVITGATSGIGLEATKQLAAASPSQMILAVRSVEAGEKVLQQIKASYKGLEGKVIHCDLQDFTSLKECVENIKRDYDRVDLLINNAGMNPNFDEGPYKSTIDGYERVFQTNVLAPLLMTFLLLPLLRRSNGPKVIFTGSDAHIFATHALIQTSVDNHQSIVGAYNDEGKYHQPARYFESKLLLQMLTRALIPHLPDLTILNVNPGLTRTNLGREFKLTLSPSTVYFILLYMVNSRSARMAARNLTSASAWKGDSQDYWSSCVPVASENTWLYSGKGMKAVEVFFKEMIDEVEKISPGCTSTTQSK